MTFSQLNSWGYQRGTYITGRVLVFSQNQDREQEACNASWWIYQSHESLEWRTEISLWGNCPVGQSRRKHNLVWPSDTGGSWRSASHSLAQIAHLLLKWTLTIVSEHWDSDLQKGHLFALQSPPVSENQHPDWSVWSKPARSNPHACLWTHSQHHPPVSSDPPSSTTDSNQAPAWIWKLNEWKDSNFSIHSSSLTHKQVYTVSLAIPTISGYKSLGIHFKYYYLYSLHPIYLDQLYSCLRFTIDYTHQSPNLGLHPSLLLWTGVYKVTTVQSKSYKYIYITHNRSIQILYIYIYITCY